MEAYELTQKLFGGGYDVHAPGGDAVVMAVRDGTLHDGGEKGPALGRVKPNFWATRAKLFDPDGNDIGELEFPSPLSFKGKTFALHTADAVYRARYEATDRAGKISSGVFRCADDRGEVALEIEKQLTLKHRFSVRFAPAMPREIAVLAAVAVDQRFFRMQ
jgi:hypothetical protein